MSERITPTVGQSVWLHFANPTAGIPFVLGKPLAATVAAIHDDGDIAIGFLDANGEHHGMAKVRLVLEGDTMPGHECHCVLIPQPKKAVPAPVKVEVVKAEAPKMEPKPAPKPVVKKR